MTSSIFSHPTIEGFKHRLNKEYDADFQPSGLNRLRWIELKPDSHYPQSKVTVRFDPATGDAKISAEGEGLTAKDFEPNEVEAEAIKQAILAHDWPKQEFIDLGDRDLPDLWLLAADDSKWAYRDQDNHVTMLEVRTDRNGQKAYIPITRYDGEYLFSAPLGSNPIYNLERIKKDKVSTVFLHEGAKAAAAAQHIVDDAKSKHPWRADLSYAVHLGITGGAYATADTAFEEIKRLGVTTYYVVSDNDDAGRLAGHKIAKRLDGVVYLVQVGGEFRPGWDFADQMPDKFFNKSKIWTGPTFNSTIFPVTYATYAYDDEQGKKRFGLKRDFANQWYFVNDEAMFCHRRFPEIFKTEKAFNDYVAPYSAVPDTAERVKREATCHIDATVYRPGKKNAVLVENNRRLFNVYRENDFPAMEGDATPWLEFITYLLPNEGEQRAFLTWFYTLLGSPETRMNYSCLMYSAQQGTGKSIVGDIIYRIIGDRNSTIINSKSLDGTFNSHWENRRCIVINELYEGGSNFKTTNALKTVLTDAFIRINSKYRQERTVENHTHIFAASNSDHALDLDDQDRRWLVVQTTDTPWSKDQFAALIEWLFDDVGCNIILGLAQKHKSYVKRGDRAPMTAAKSETIWQTKSDIVVAIDTFDTDHKDSLLAIPTKMFQDFITDGKGGPKSDSLQANCQRMKSKGWAILNQRDPEFDGFRPTITGKGKLACIVSPALKIRMLDKKRDDWSALIAPHLKTPHDLPASDRPF